MRDYVPPWTDADFIYVHRQGFFDIIDLGGAFPSYLATAETKDAADLIVKALRLMRQS